MPDYFDLPEQEKGQYAKSSSSHFYLCVRSARSGVVTGTVRPVHIGKSTHVWDIKITDDAEKLVCVCRLTTAVLPIAAS